MAKTSVRTSPDDAQENSASKTDQQDSQHAFNKLTSSGKIFEEIDLLLFFAICIKVPRY
jgi:hypothetical protein